MGKSYNALRHLHKTMPKTGGNKTKSVFEMNNSTRVRGYYGNFDQAKKDGFLMQNYVNDTPLHFSDPPYVTIKPNYQP
jgi:hypothetical protein